MASVSFETSICDFIISSRNAWIHSFPCCRSSWLCPSRPSSTIWSRRLAGSWASTCAGEPCGWLSAGIVLTFLFFRFRGCCGLTGLFSQRFRLGDGFLQKLFELIVAVEASAQIGKLCSQLQKLI